jgi:hypothetical protein
VGFTAEATELAPGFPAGFEPGFPVGFALGFEGSASASCVCGAKGVNAVLAGTPVLFRTLEADRGMGPASTGTAAAGVLLFAPCAPFSARIKPPGACGPALLGFSPVGAVAAAVGAPACDSCDLSLWSDRTAAESAVPDPLCPALPVPAPWRMNARFAALEMKLSGFTLGVAPAGLAPEADAVGIVTCPWGATPLVVSNLVASLEMRVGGDSADRGDSSRVLAG